MGVVMVMMATMLMVIMWHEAEDVMKKWAYKGGIHHGSLRKGEVRGLARQKGHEAMEGW